MGGTSKPWRGVMMLFLAASLLFSSGCAALLLVGAGGAGGYLIRKGEEAEKEEGSELEPSSKPVPASRSEAGQDIVLLGGRE